MQTDFDSVFVRPCPCFSRCGCNSLKFTMIMLDDPGHALGPASHGGRNHATAADEIVLRKVYA